MSLDLTRAEAQSLVDAINATRRYYLDRGHAVMPKHGVQGIPDEPAEQPENPDLAGACGWNVTAAALADMGVSLRDAAASPAGPLQAYRDDRIPREDADYYVTVQRPTETGGVLMAALFNGYRETPNWSRDTLMLIRRINDLP